MTAPLGTDSATYYTRICIYVLIRIYSLAICVGLCAIVPLIRLNTAIRPLSRFLRFSPSFTHRVANVEDYPVKAVFHCMHFAYGSLVIRLAQSEVREKTLIMPSVNFPDQLPASASYCKYANVRDAYSAATIYDIDSDEKYDDLKTNVLFFNCSFFS